MDSLQAVNDIAELFRAIWMIRFGVVGVFVCVVFIVLHNFFKGGQNV